MDRRAFLKVAGAIGGVAVAGAAGVKVVAMLTQDQVRTIRAGVFERLVARHGETQGKVLAERIEQEFETALLELPNLGTTEDNRWASNMPSTAFALAAYRALTPEYASLEEVGWMIYQTAQEQMSGVTPLIMKATYDEQGMIEKTRSLAARSQRRQYPEDWVMTFVEGAGDRFAYGVDVTECAILKYLTAQGAAELTKYLCLTDKLTSDAMGRGLVRYETIAEGYARCDFRYKQGRPSYLHPLRDGWPPKFA